MKTYPRDQVVLALNKAADDICEQADLPDEGVRDGLNLLVNAAVAFLDGTASTLREVVEGTDGYQEGTTLEDVLDWTTRG